MPPFCSFPCKGMEVGIPCWKVERHPIRHFLRLWPESAKSSGDLIRPFFPCQPGAYRWGLINCAISRLSYSQDCWSIKGIPWWIISFPISVCAGCPLNHNENDEVFIQKLLGRARPGELNRTIGDFDAKELGGRRTTWWFVKQAAVRLP